MSDSNRSEQESLATQHERLASLESCEERIRALRDRECDREVEHMAAEAALHGATNRLQPGVDRQAAARIGHLLEVKRELQSRLQATGGYRGSGSTSAARTLDQLRAGHAALLAWLDAGSPRQPGAVARYGRIVMLLASIAILWAAIAIHPAFLLLLVVVVGPVSFAMSRGQDDEWRRVGARRRYDASGLADFGEWNEVSVRARAGELEALLDQVAPREAHRGREHPADTTDEAEASATRLADLDRRIAAELADVGLEAEAVEGEIGEWLRLAERAETSRRALDEVKSERRRVRDEALELREQLGRYLRSHGIKPTAHQDSAADIAARLGDLQRTPGGGR